MTRIYRNVGTSPLTMPDGSVLPPGETYAGELPPALAAWYASIGGLTVEPSDEPDVVPPSEDEEA